jgi:ADP-ribose pyrophosphatase YjhB (NUDIX family)
MSEQHPLTKAEFDSIFSKVPRLTVEVLINTPDGVVMTKVPRGVLAGQWNMPGGTVRLGEPLVEAVKRVAQSELGVDVKVGKNVGYIEYPELPKAGYKGWPVGIVFEATIVSGELTVSDAGEEVRCFNTIPSNTVESQARFLIDYIRNHKF